MWEPMLTQSPRIFWISLSWEASIQRILRIPKPRVGLLSAIENSDDRMPGTETEEVISKAELNFVDRVDCRDIFQGVADVIVRDGFMGNVAL
jgi:phosphate acyltransferase